MVGPLLLLLLMASPVALGGEEILDTWPDGTPRVRYRLDAEGRLHGTRTEYFENGKVAVKAGYRHGEFNGTHAVFYETGKKRSRGIYRRGARIGKYEEWDGEGRLTWKAHYRAGRLHGKAYAWRGREVVAKQAWNHGEIKKIKGVLLPTRVRGDVVRAIHRLLDGAGITRKETAARDLEADRRAAVLRLHAYRFLCGLPWKDVVLDDTANAYAQAASRISAANGDISHTPPNPGWEAQKYAFAAHGAENCNLHQGVGAAASVDGYMDDSDKRNIEKLGHRRWCLNPRMRIVGFGAARNDKGRLFTAMWATDTSRAKVPDLPFVAYPPAGWVPIELFGPRYAWSVQFPRGAASAMPDVSIEVAVHLLDERFLPVGEPLPLDFQKVERGDDGQPACVIFRPARLTLEAPADYLVTIQGVETKANEGVPLRYLVRWCRLEAAPAADGE